MDGDDAVWRFYRKAGDGHELPTRPSYAMVTACMQAGLFRIVNESLNLYCGHRGDVSATSVLTIYKMYLDWKEDLPPKVRQIEIDDQPLPHILYLQYVICLYLVLPTVQWVLTVLKHPVPHGFSPTFRTSPTLQLLHRKRRRRISSHDCPPRPERDGNPGPLAALIFFTLPHAADDVLHPSPR